MGRTIKVSMVESFVSIIYRNEIEIDIEQYPELLGKTDDEIREYIINYASEMKSPEEFSYGDNLWEACMEMDVANEKIKNEEYEIDVEFE